MKNCIIFGNKIMNALDGEEKRLVESYKATNRQLRKQL